MATTTTSKETTIVDKPNLKFIYRADVLINDVALEGTSFIGLNESFDILGSLYPLRILMLSIPATFFDSKAFITNRTVKVKFSLFAGEMTDIPMDDPEYKYTEKLLYNKEFTGYIDNEFIPLGYDEIQAMKKNEEQPEALYMMRVHLLETIQNPFVEDVFNTVTNQETQISDLIVSAFLKCANTNLSLHIDPPTNVTKIPVNTLIKPMGFLQLLDYIQKSRGMYDHGFNTFIIDKIAYILSKEGVRDKDPTWIISTPPVTSLNQLSLGYRSGSTDNTIVVDKSAISMNDTKHEYYVNTYSKIDEEGKVHDPSNKKISNVSLFVDNDELVQSNYNNKNITKRLRDISVTMTDTYIDFTPTDVFQIETVDFIIQKLSIWSYRRIVTPKGATTFVNLFTRT